MCSGGKEELDLGQEGGSLSLKIDTAYARSYEKRKRGEELSQLRDKYGDDTETSCSELEDEFGRGLSADNDKSFLRVLSLIRQKHASLFDPGARFYASESDTSLSEEETGLFLRDYEREQLLKGAGLADSESECEGQGLAYNPEQREIKRDLLEAARDGNASNDELSGADFLQPRVKSRAELLREDTDYSDWLKTNPNIELERPESISLEQASDLSHLRNFWSRADLSEEDRFLRDYLLERRHLGDRGTDGTEGESSFEDQDLEQVDEADEFERKYNFRFEEEDSSTVARYPRSVPSSVRREDTRRVEQRRALGERKEREKTQEREEVKRLKNLKKMEIQDKIELIMKITGNKSLGIGNLDLSADFDSEQHDREMSSVFNHGYLDEKEYSKPDLSSLLPEGLRDSDSESLQLDSMHCEDEGFLMDADYIGDKQKYRNDNISKGPASNSHINQSMEDYYNIDYQDKIGDLACRMKYRDVIPNSFGLSIEEILTAEDRELNQWASLKKTVQYRGENEERREVRKYSRKGRDLGKKKRVFISLYDENANSGKINNSKTKTNETPSISKQQKRIINNNKLSDKQKKVISTMSNTRLKAYNINPKKGINKRKNYTKHKSFV